MNYPVTETQLRIVAELSGLPVVVIEDDDGRTVGVVLPSGEILLPTGEVLTVGEEEA